MRCAAFAMDDEVNNCYVWSQQ